MSKRTLDVSVEGLESRSYSQATEIEALVSAIALEDAPHVVMESTGGYERELWSSLERRGIRCTVVNAMRARAFSTSLGSLAKTDAIDAQMLAKMGRCLGLKAMFRPAESVQRLRMLAQRREQLVKLQVVERNHREHGKEATVVESILRVQEVLKNEIQSLDRAIKETLEETVELKERVRQLQTVPGIGPVVSSGLVAGLPELGSLSKSQVAALTGLAPYNSDSGGKQGKRKLAGGRRPIRRLLYMAALVASRANASMKQFYERLVAEGKPKKVALLALARKLVVALNAMVKSGQDWCPDRVFQPTS
ncbi:MAG: IS110 family transposase [Myxococcales bacterium]|nr:IS110 family transposase [Myxococcales bacterium]